ncbi:MAG: entericidin A/B family lipoprotein [Halomonas sp.]|nr:MULTISPECIES: entericidin A/B family lipoprotein [unclassified Halomonas]KPQ20475.1 MAG: putative small secreted protein [Halomonas sp. HL-93]MCA1771099.1 entericidin A/B family lipoprotein [Halomonas sp.]SBR46273.1 Predicted small secreted protein [Halomonas sp. HL-93]SNY98670.1 Predicted small secreted protein [Halomonas sp. hl-4]
MKKLLAMSFILLMSAGALAGCNTIGGAGQDVEEGGEAVQDAAS